MYFQQQAYIINLFLMALDALCVVLAGISAYYIKYYLAGQRWFMPLEVFFLSIGFVALLNNYLMGRFRLYSDKKPSSTSRLLWSIMRVVLLDFAFLSMAIFLVKYKKYSRLFLLLFATFTFVFIIIYRLIAIWYIGRRYQQKNNASRILIVGDTNRAEWVSHILKHQLSWGHKVIGRLFVQPEEQHSDAPLGSIEELPQVLQHESVDEIVFALAGDSTCNVSSYLDICKKIGIHVRILPYLWEPDVQSLSAEICQGVPFLIVHQDKLNSTGLLYKRFLDLIGGLLGTIILCIMYPFVAIAIKLDSSGPVIFKQERVGWNGRLFTLYKFRSMYVDAEQHKQELLGSNEMQGAMFKLESDPRITRVGKWLRKTSLDEFPQFWNVLKGEMSLVGTRPPTPEEVHDYQLHHLKRISAKPGITGLWQVSGRNKITDFEKVVELDCQYLENWRFVHDIKILLKTIWVVLLRKGAL